MTALCVQACRQRRRTRFISAASLINELVEAQRNGQLSRALNRWKKWELLAIDEMFRAYWKNAFLKQYEKFSRFLRNELCSNNLRDFGLKKGLDHLDAVRKRFQVINDRFAGCQASGSTCTWIFRSCSAWPCPSRLGPFAIQASKSMRRGSSDYWKCSCMAATPSGARLRNKFIRPYSPPFNSHRILMD